MKIVTYNINGIRAAKKLGLIEWIEDYNADVYCFQEVRANQQVTSEILAELSSQISLFDSIDKNSILDKFTPVYNCGSISGYAGTLILTKEKPKQILYDRASSGLTLKDVLQQFF